MFSKRNIFRMFILLIAVLLISSTASARPLADALSTVFTYQGRLSDGGAPANGSYDFQFRLYDALSDGGQVGGDLPLEDVPVSGGLFSVQLDFGPVFDGRVLYLDIGVRPGSSTGAYTPLTPRQPLTPTPNALYALQASNADLLDGNQAGAFSLTNHDHWGQTWTGTGTGLTLNGGTTGLSAFGSTAGVYGTSDNIGVYGYGTSQSYGVYGYAPESGGFGVQGMGPTGVRGRSNDPGGYGIWGYANGGAGTNYAGYFDGNVQINGSLGITSNTLVANLNADLLDGKQASAFAPDAKNVVIVAKSGGDFTTITAALNSITDATASNPYLISIAPGVYTEQVMMKPYVDIEGSGELTTMITFTGSSYPTNGTLAGANNAELRFLTVENTGGGYSYAIAINNSSAAPRLTHVTARASGGGYENDGVHNALSSPTMTDVTASATGGTGSSNAGVYNSSSSPAMINVTASATGGTGSLNSGVYNAYSSPTINKSNISSSGGSNNYGIYNYSGSGGSYTVLVNNSQISASGGTNNYGVYSNGTAGSYTLLVNNSQISASGGTINCGIYTNASGASYIMQVNNSQISGSTNTIANDSHTTTRVGASQLNGGAASAGGGTLTCAGVYDENYVFYASTCP